MGLHGSGSSTSSLVLRLAQPEDALAVARVHVRSWQSAYRGLLPQTYLDALRPEDRAPHYNFAHTDKLQPRTVVAADDHALYGFITTMPSREPDLQGTAELAALYVDPDHWGKGLGVMLMEAATQHLAAAGYEQAYLWLLAGNTRADRFYTHDGWQTDGTQKTDVMWGVPVQELRYRRGLIQGDRT